MSDRHQRGSVWVKGVCGQELGQPSPTFSRASLTHPSIVTHVCNLSTWEMKAEDQEFKVIFDYIINSKVA